MLWVTDPVTKNKSVSLTMLMLSGVLIITFGILQIFGKVQSVGPFDNMFWSSAALYFGRRLGINGKNYSADKTE